jgi:ABC-type Mn2+/Zn2+ transport system permease subunit
MRLVGAILTTAFFLIPLGVTAWAFLDAARRPSWAWSLADRSQVAWMVATALGVFTVIGGLLISGYYLTVIRHQVADAEDGRVRGTG